MVRKRIESDVDLKRMKILILEKNGNKLSAMSNNIDPYKPDFCGRTKCFPCTTATKPTRGSCWVPGATYKIECLACVARGTKAVYTGESGHNSHYRGLAHLQGLERNKPNNVLVKHNDLYHGGKEGKVEDFRMSLLAGYRRPICRQSREGIEIQSTLNLQKQLGHRDVIIMNSRSDFNQPGVVRSTHAPLLAHMQ